MPLAGHLRELRSRLVKSLLAVTAGFAVCYIFSDQIFGFLVEPLKRFATTDFRMIGTGVTEAFFTKLKVAILGGVFLASPVILYQVWAFVAPGLYQNEKRVALPVLFTGTLFFILGALFCYRVVFVYGYGFFLREFAPMGIRPHLRVSEYLTLSAKLFLIFGAVFEFPVLILFLTRSGVLNHRVLIRQLRYAVVGVFILAAILTPPDFVSQVLVAVPLLFLYGVGIGVAFMFRRRDLEKAGV
jgi:sec-independent protein translocase protein TatC